MKYTFEELNNEINRRLSEDDTYLSSGNSYIKIFQHGLVYALMESHVKPLKPYFNLPIFLQKIMFKRGKKNTTPSFVLKENVILDSGIPLNNESKDTSFFFNKIISELGSNVSTINLNPERGLKCDFNIHQLTDTKINFDETLNSKLIEVNDVYSKLQRSSLYSSLEKAYISSALHVFFHTFLRYYSVLRSQNVKRVYLTVHYNNEGIIGAAQSCGIEVIEMQHGLIHPLDLYYCYNKNLAPRLKKGYFPDRILLFGEYWKSVLLKGGEWEPSQLEIIGSVLPTHRSVNKSSEKTNTILIGSQKLMTEQYIPRIRQLLKTIENYPDWKIILKLHPLEKEVDKYQALKHPQLEIAPLASDLSDLLSRCKIQISVYSTTFYDAAGFDVMNFSWQGDGFGSDYARFMVAEGIAEALTSDEDPIEKYNTLISNHYSFLKRSAFYAPFNHEIIVK
ncbi:MAG: hypothetical protein R2809_01830 [Flavobacteriales bacterium]